LDNGTSGADARSPIAYLTQKLGHQGIIVTNVPHTLNEDTGSAKGTYGAVQFELFAESPREFLNYERSVAVAFDGGKWRFEASGRVQAFEEVEKYSSRRVQDRLTPEMLARYCAALGVDLNNEGFYSGPGVRVEILDPLPC
jgi:hypothetical protein